MKNSKVLEAEIRKGKEKCQYRRKHHYKTHIAIMPLRWSRGWSSPLKRWEINMHSNGAVMHDKRLRKDCKGTKRIADAWIKESYRTTEVLVGKIGTRGKEKACPSQDWYVSRFHQGPKISIWSCIFLFTSFCSFPSVWWLRQHCAVYVVICGPAIWGH